MVRVRDFAEDGLEWRIWRLLDSRRAMRVSEMQKRLGVSASAIHASLEKMMERNEVIRFRPINCNMDEHDFFGLNRPQSRTARMEEKMSSVYIGVERRLKMQPAGELMAYLMD